MQIRDNKNNLLEYNETLMKYLNIYQIRKEKNLPAVYNPFYENLEFDGPKMKPNRSRLEFFANGHNNKSAFLSTYIEKCNNGTKRNPLYKGLIFNKVMCAPAEEIEKYVGKLNAEFHFEYRDIDIQERNFENTIF